MNKEQTEGKYEQLKGEIKKTWGKLTDNDLMLYKGERQKFLGRVTELQGIAKEKAEEKLKAMEDACRCDSTDSKVA
jgi:uncharacterized protein YjbJ (UPF0337 family)